MNNTITQNINGLTKYKYDLEQVASTLLPRIQDAETKAYLERSIRRATTIKRIKRVFKKLYRILMEQGSTESEAVQESVEEVMEQQESKTYDEPPTFDQAVQDIIYAFCNDIANIPDLPEYLAGVEKTIWDASGILGNGRRIGNGGWGGNMREPTEVDTIVKKGMLLVSADCQSGKTRYTICSAIKGMLRGQTAVLVVRRNTGDAKQLKRSCDNLISAIEAYLVRHGVKERRIPFEIVNGKEMEDVNVANGVERALANGLPQIIICLGNETQLGRLNEIVKRTTCSYSIYIDEIDNVDYGVDSKAASILAELKGQSYQTIGITATPLDSIFSEEDMKSANQQRLTPPADYRGFIDFVVKLLVTAPGVSALNKLATFEELCVADPNLKPFLRYFSTTNADYAKVTVRYPNICLVKNTRFNQNQEALFHGVNANFPNKFITIVYNGNGVMIEGYRLPERMEIGGCVVRKGEYFKGDISIVLQYLKDNGGTRNFPRIIIFAGDLAGRCISYVSADYDWHLTDMYYVPAANTPIPELIQSAGRLCGRNRGKSHLHLHTTKATADAIYSGFNFTNEVINRAIASPFLREDMEEVSMAESVKAVKMNKKKMPVGRELTTKVKVAKRDFNTVSGEDGGLSLENYKFRTSKPQEEGEESKEERVQEESKDSDHASAVVGSEEQKGLERLYKNLRQAIVGNRLTVVVRILKFFYTNRVTSHSKTIIKNMCNVADFGHYTEWRERNGRYALLVEDGINWKLNPVAMGHIQELLPQVYNM